MTAVAFIFAAGAAVLFIIAAVAARCAVRWARQAKAERQAARVALEMVGRTPGHVGPFLYGAQDLYGITIETLNGSGSFACLMVGGVEILVRRGP